jgi:hypothetical protein
VRYAYVLISLQIDLQSTFFTRLRLLQAKAKTHTHKKQTILFPQLLSVSYYRIVSCTKSKQGFASKKNVNNLSTKNTTLHKDILVYLSFPFLNQSNSPPIFDAQTSL